MLNEKLKNILFVCIGNTCRSPMCAAVARHAYGLNAISRGLDADGSPMAKDAVLALRAVGFPCEEGRISQQISEEDMRDASLIVTVTPTLANILKQGAPEYADKIRSTPFPIPDPFGGDLEKYKDCLAAIRMVLALMIGQYTEGGPQAIAGVIMDYCSDDSDDMEMDDEL